MGAIETFLDECWFCGRLRVDLIAGFDDWDEQRLACSDCHRLLEHMAERGYTLSPIKEPAVLSENPERPDVRD